MHINPKSDTYIKHMVTEYPFLRPHHVYGEDFGEPIEPYDYDWCELDRLPWGWQITFIQDFLKELKNLLIKKKILDKYFVVITKEDNNEFVWRGNLDYWYPEIQNLVNKYAKEVPKHCFYCEHKPKYRSTWGYFVCDSCAIKEFSRANVPVWELEFEKLDS